MRWDIFCHVVDNYGDAGVCWRLARKLTRSSSDEVFLWVDKPDVINAVVVSSKQFTAIDNDSSSQPTLPNEPTLRQWQRGSAQTEVEFSSAAQVVLSTFGCELDAALIAAMAAAKTPPLWINLEYLSAESYIERSHGLASPQPSGLTQWYFYPGFTERSGGLLLDTSLPGNATAHREPHSKPTVFLFSYESPAIAGLLAACRQLGWQVLLAAGRSQDFVDTTIDSDFINTVAHKLPFIAQEMFDEKLVGNALNVVRGEDSFVQALGTGCPLIWHIYPQTDGAHWPKLEAFFALYMAGCAADARAALWAAWRAFNQPLDRAYNPDETAAAQVWLQLAPHLPVLRTHALLWAQKLQKQPGLSAKLRRFVLEKLNTA